MGKMNLKKIVWFSAAHLLLNYEGKCSKLHGHNWKVVIKVEGEPDKESGILIDFTQLKNIVEELDHKILIPQENNLICFVGDYSIAIDNTTYRFPEKDCVLLPYKNITAENLVNYFLKKILNSNSHIKDMEVEVWESETSCAKNSRGRVR